MAAILLGDALSLVACTEYGGNYDSAGIKIREETAKLYVRLYISKIATSWSNVTVHKKK